MGIWWPALLLVSARLPRTENSPARPWRLLYHHWFCSWPEGLRRSAPLSLTSNTWSTRRVRHCEEVLPCVRQPSHYVLYNFVMPNHIRYNTLRLSAEQRLTQKHFPSMHLKTSTEPESHLGAYLTEYTRYSPLFPCFFQAHYSQASSLSTRSNVKHEFSLNQV